jgi:hypothetical protein
MGIPRQGQTGSYFDGLNHAGEYRAGSMGAMLKE